MTDGEKAMKIIDRIQEKQKNLGEEKPITIAFLGDSVTQGCFDCYEEAPGKIETEFHPEWGYVELFKRMLHKLYPSVPLAVINAGVSGSSAYGGVCRLERDVLSFSPDLVVVCFGLNDTNNGMEGVEKFRKNLTDIFRRIRSSGAECIYMTPNTMNYLVSPHITSDAIKDLAVDLRGRMTSGMMDAYMEAARETARAEGVPLCDCYALWKRMAASGINVTELLANRMNHPDKDMHFLFAYELLKTILS